MDRFRSVPLASTSERSRRTMLGTVLAAAGAASGLAGTAGKKKKKKCKARATKCGKKGCCQPGEECVNGQCAAPTTTPLTAISCNGPKDDNLGGVTRYAQIFEATGTGLIATASFEVSSIAADTPFGVEIRTTQNGAPTSTVIGTAIIFGLPSSSSGISVTATFAPKVAVELGQVYAVVITDLAKKGFAISVRNAGGCPRPFFEDTFANNTFAARNESLIFTVSP